jgi:hypothetical protein
MAQIIPAEPVEGAPTAKRCIFRLWCDDIEDDLVALHSVAWLVPDGRKKPRQGEVDFVLAHPGLGVLAIAVKGGSIRFDASGGLRSCCVTRLHGRAAAATCTSPSATQAGKPTDGPRAVPEAGQRPLLDPVRLEQLRKAPRPCLEVAPLVAFTLGRRRVHDLCQRERSPPFDDHQGAAPPT